MNNSSLWKKVLDEIAVETSSMTFSSLFKDTRLDTVDNGAIVIYCPNEGVRFILQNKYKNTIVSLLKKHHDAINVVTFKTGSTQQKENTQPPPPLFLEQTNNIDEKLRKINISPRLTFENFAVSVSNQMAHAAALAVSKNPGNAYNPLFIWGGVGVGKTHLLHALGRKLIESSNAKVYYCSAEDFTNELVFAIQNKSTRLFRKKYREVDALLIDDIQFVSQREFVQEELFNTFNKLKTQGKQVVFTSDKPPKAIKNIEKRLVSRFLSGLVIDVQQPDFELKTAILLIKAQEQEINIDIETAKTISANIEELRELEGFLLKLSALKEMGTEINNETVQRILIQSGLTHQNNHNPKGIIKIVCQEMDIKLKELKEDNRKKNIVTARHVAMYLLKTFTNLTYEDIASLVGKKDHTTVMHGVQKIIKQISHDDSLRKKIEKIKLHIH